MDTTQFTKNNCFLMLALDHRGSIKRLINPDNPAVVNRDEVVELKRQIIDTLKDQFSGILIDSVFGLPAYTTTLHSMVVKKPYLLSIERSGYIEEGGGRVTELGYTVEELKQKGASGVKIMLYYNPSDKSAQKQLQTAKKVLEDCRKNNLPLFLEVVTYLHNVGVDQCVDPNKKEQTRGSAPTKSESIIQSINILLENNIKPDVFKLEYPGDESSCQKITRILGDIPWILLTKGEDFGKFKDNLRVAIKNGARGFLAGRSIWQESASLKNDQRKEFLENIVKKRFKEISEIAI